MHDDPAVDCCWGSLALFLDPEVALSLLSEYPAINKQHNAQSYKTDRRSARRFKRLSPPV